MEINRLPKRSAALAALEGFRHLTPIQEQVIPLALKGRDIIGIGSSTLVQSFKKVKNFKSPLFIDDLKFFCCQVLKFYVACVVCVAPLLYNILEVFDHETLV